MQQKFNIVLKHDGSNYSGRSYNKSVRNLFENGGSCNDVPMNILLKRRPNGRKDVLIAGLVLLIIYTGVAIGGGVYQSYECAGNDDCKPLIKNDEMIIGLLGLMGLLIYVLWYSKNWVVSLLFRVVPPLCFSFFLPGFYSSLRIYDPNTSDLPKIASLIILPCCLFLYCLACDMLAVFNLGWRLAIVFLSGSFGVMIGGPIALAIVIKAAPETCDRETWSALSYMAGAWIGGVSNGTAMIEIFNPEKELLPSVIVTQISGTLLSFGILSTLIVNFPKLCEWNKLDIEKLLGAFSDDLEDYNRQDETHVFLLFCLTFFVVGFSNLAGGLISDCLKAKASPWLIFTALDNYDFWRLFMVTMIGILVSTTPVSRLKVWGAINYASFFLQLMIMILGMSNDVTKLFSYPFLFVIGGIWLLIHYIFVLVTAVVTGSSFFHICVGSQGNIGGTATTPLMAAKIDRRLARVGIIYGVLGDVIGTFFSWGATIMMKKVQSRICP